MLNSKKMNYRIFKLLFIYQIYIKEKRRRPFKLVKNYICWNMYGYVYYKLIHLLKRTVFSILAHWAVLFIHSLTFTLARSSNAID